MARKKKLRLTLTPGWALYLRTSDEEAQAPERSQASQRRMIHEQLCTNSDVPIVAEYADTFSGRATDRRSYQHLMADARLGKFSHVGVAFVDRFGRNDVEGIRAFDELINLGIVVRIATYPSLDPATPDGRMIVGVLFSVARYESLRIGQRSREGMYTKLLEGGWSGRAPDGYLNCEMKTNMVSAADKLKNARYKRWIEIDPQQAPVWRYAWDLLLEDRYSLEEICEILHSKGFKLRSGASFVTVGSSGLRRCNAGSVSRIFHNWFYAGWVVSDSELGAIPPKTIRGHWEPIVSTEEFEVGLAILQRRNQQRVHQRKHFYLLQGLIYLKMPSGRIAKLSCAMPNANRARGGVKYYCLDHGHYYFLCRRVDEQLIDYLQAVQIDGRWIPKLRRAFEDDIDQLLGPHYGDQRPALQEALRGIEEEESRTARLYASGRITDDVWNLLWTEWQDRRETIRRTLTDLDKSRHLHLANLDAALSVITKLGILYNKVDKENQRDLLRHIIKRVIINVEGKIIEVELRTPFTYLRSLLGGDESSPSNNGSRGIAENVVGNQAKTSAMAGSVQPHGFAPGGIRTHDTQFRKPLLWPLSYEGNSSNYSLAKISCGWQA